MPSSIMAFTSSHNLGGRPSQFQEDVITDCQHVEDPKDAIKMEDGFIACGPCGKSLQGFEKAFGEEGELTI